MITGRQKGYAAAILFSLIIGFSFMSVKIALVTANPTDLLAYRFAVAFAAISIPLFLKKVKVDIGIKELLAILPLAFFYPALFFFLQTLGLVHIASTEAGIIQATVPIFTLLLARIFLNEQTNGLQKAFVILSVSGVLFISVMNGIQVAAYSFVGIALILGSTMAVAINSVLARKLTKKYPVYTLTYVMTVFGFIAFTLMALIQHGLDGSFNEIFVPLRSTSFIISVLYLGILSSAGSSFLSTYAVSQIEASKMGVFNNLSTVVTIFAGYLFLQENLFWYHIVGAVVIIIGVLGTNYFGRVKGERR